MNVSKLIEASEVERVENLKEYEKDANNETLRKLWESLSTQILIDETTQFKYRHVLQGIWLWKSLKEGYGVILSEEMDGLEDLILYRGGK